MTRLFAIAAALLVVVIVLYLPAAHPPEYFVDRLKREHELNIAFWGPDAGFRILGRMLDLQAGLENMRGATAASKTLSSAVDPAVAGEVGRVAHRILTNEYFRSIDTLMAVASYRLAVLLEWLPILMVLIIALFVDGCITRAIRSREFLQHHPEVFGLCMLALIGSVCAALIAAVMPITIHPLAMFAFLGRRWSFRSWPPPVPI